MVTLKTGFYLAAPLLGGAIVAGATQGVLSTLESLGAKIGPIFQIADDVIDLTEGKGRGEKGSDIKEGKRSFLVVHVAGRCTSDEREKLFDILDKPRPETTAEDVHWVMGLFDKYGAVKGAKSEGRRLLEDARELMGELPRPLNSNLAAAVEFMLERKI